MTTDEKPAVVPDPQDLSRFQVSKGTLLVDRFMGWAVHVGGIFIIVAVLGVFFYLLAVVAPLFKKAHVEDSGLATSLGMPGAAPLLASDEAGRSLFFYSGGPSAHWIRTGLDSADGSEGQEGSPGNVAVTDPEPFPLPFTAEGNVTSWTYRAYKQEFTFGFDNGKVATMKLTFGEDGTPLASPGGVHVLHGEGKVYQAGFASSGVDHVYAGLVEASDGIHFKIVTMKEKRGLGGAGVVTPESEQDLSEALHGVDPKGLLVSQTTREILVRLADGEVLLFGRINKGFEQRQSFRPFEASEGELASMEFIFGDVSVVATSTLGKQKLFSLQVPEGGSQRVFVQTKSFEDLPGGPTAYIASVRNKSFLTAAGKFVSLRYATNESIRWEKELDYPVAAASLNGKNDALFLLGQDGVVRSFHMNDHFPEAGAQAFFGKVWYEGQSKPTYTWQSSSGNDDYEPKYSMMPLIFGSLKGTLYSMLISVPIALLAAIYTSQFLGHGAKRIIKPTMEIMASLPSVVLGFLAALWLAPKIQYKFPSVLTVLILTPLFVIAASYLWNALPTRVRNRIPKGTEYFFLIPVVIIGAGLGWLAGPLTEMLFFRAPHPTTGEMVPDFTLWWIQPDKFLPLAPLLLLIPGIPILLYLGGTLKQRVDGAKAKFATPALVVIGSVLLFGIGMLLETFMAEYFVTKQYDQRNALVVGFMMGFAVIPVIFTIAEDSLSNVPVHLSAAGFALGASRWQVMRMVILPTAAAGIFSALMIGFGRAVGETMVVVMAAGNTPIMEWNPFSGMRTLSANLAVELPEAPAGTTHYRALHLGALILLIMTFVINTIAEVVRQHLRNKFKVL
jgi:phosphate transport system permease protein